LNELFEVRPVFRRLQILLSIGVGSVLLFAFLIATMDHITRMLRGNRHNDVVVKTMLSWSDDSRNCQLFNGNPVVVGGARTMKEGDHLQMFCPVGNIEGDWRLTYVGTVKLDDASEREFESHDKYFVPVLCNKDAKTFDCIKQTN
jgi:hypothetical protein